MTKNEDEAWELFNILSDNFIHHALVSRSDRVTPIIIQKKSGDYDSIHLVDIHNKVDLLTRKLDQVLFVGRGQVPTFTPPTQQKVCYLCSNLTHYISDCLMATQYPEFIQEQIHVAQDFSRPINDLFSNTYNL